MPIKHFFHPCDSRACGFTLIEILVSIFIFSIVATMLMYAYTAALSKNKAVEDSIEQLQMVQACFFRMKSDLEAIRISLPPEYKKPQLSDEPDNFRLVGDMNSIGAGSFSRLRFASWADVPPGPFSYDGIAEIVYYVQRTDDDRFVLKRANRHYPFGPFEEKASDPILCYDVKEVKFEYLDSENQSRDNWDTESLQQKYASPRAVRIYLAIGPNDGSANQFETTVALPVFRSESK